MYLCTCVYMHTYDIHMYVHTHKHVYIHAYAYSYTYTPICTLIHIHIHERKHAELEARPPPPQTHTCPLSRTRVSCLTPLPFNLTQYSLANMFQSSEWSGLSPNVCVLSEIRTRMACRFQLDWCVAAEGARQRWARGGDLNTPKLPCSMWVDPRSYRRGKTVDNPA